MVSPGGAAAAAAAAAGVRRISWVRGVPLCSAPPRLGGACSAEFLVRAASQASILPRTFTRAGLCSRLRKGRARFEGSVASSPPE